MRLRARSAAAVRRLLAIVARHLGDLLLVAGLGMAIAGVNLLLGLAWTLLVAGVVTVGYGAAWELRGPRR